MPTKRTDREFRASQNAISSFIKVYGYHSTRTIRVDQGTRTLYSSECSVSAEINYDESVVKIFFDDDDSMSDFESKFFTEYNNNYQLFRYNSGELTIVGEDRNGNAIKITIS